MTKHDWTFDQIRDIYRKPFPDLVFDAQTTHREHFSPNLIQRSTLLSVKTGGCSENCAYCPQSAHYDTGVKNESVLPKPLVLEKAEQAKAEGSTRFCMGAAWREVEDNDEFEQVLELVRDVSATGLEVCCTLGMLTADRSEEHTSELQSH